MSITDERVVPPTQEFEPDRPWRLHPQVALRDESFGADLAWFEGTPVALAASLTPGSWLARRIAHYGDSPCAFVLTAAGGITGQKPSNWFGRSLFWFDAARLGWRLGVWINP